MEKPQETPCIVTLFSNKQKCHGFLFVFSLFSSAKSKNRRVEQVLLRRKLSTSGKGEVAGKGGRRVNTVQKNVYTCM
jgi:hypothetical protein